MAILAWISGHLVWSIDQQAADKPLSKEPVFKYILLEMMQDLDAVVACITGKPSAHQPGITNQPLEPTMATQNPELSSTNLLNELDRAAQVNRCARLFLMTNATLYELY